LPKSHLEASEKLDVGAVQVLVRVIPLAAMGDTKLKNLKTMELQEFFNSFYPRLSSKTIRLMHGGLRTALNQLKGRAGGGSDAYRRSRFPGRNGVPLI
jgi:hypothetical protein